ncbi:MAG: helix-turn-helix domain-containing protein [Nitrospira sp.]|nr:helix-turn-helix domain-containing protein [Nitrospira sp.]
MQTRSYRHLSAEEHEALSLGLTQGHSLRTMARILGCAPSTVSRAVTRNTTQARPYRACTAQSHAATQAHHPRQPRKLADLWLWQYV